MLGVFDTVKRSAASTLTFLVYTWAHDLWKCASVIIHPMDKVLGEDALSS